MTSSPTTAIPFFNHDTTLFLPSHPSLKYTRLIYPLHFPHWLAIASNPTNNTHSARSLAPWSADEIAAEKARNSLRFQRALEEQDALTYLIWWEGEVVGATDLARRVVSTEGEGEDEKEQEKEVVAWNVGLMINASARRKGIGKLTVKVMVKVAWWVIAADERLSGEEKGRARVECGTMLSNAPWRGLMGSLGVVEREEKVEIEGRGVVAEVLFLFGREGGEGWEDVLVRVEVGEKLVREEEEEERTEELMGKLK